MKPPGIDVEVKIHSRRSPNRILARANAMVGTPYDLLLGLHTRKGPFPGGNMEIEVHYPGGFRERERVDVSPFEAGEVHYVLSRNHDPAAPGTALVYLALQSNEGRPVVLWNRWGKGFGGISYPDAFDRLLVASRTDAVLVYTLIAAVIAALMGAASLLLLLRR